MEAQAGACSEEVSFLFDRFRFNRCYFVVLFRSENRLFEFFAILIIDEIDKRKMDIIFVCMFDWLFINRMIWI